MQLGFDLEYTDPNTKELVPWALPTPKLLADIRKAPWKVIDVETTGLNPASKEQNFSAKDIRRGVNPSLRLRVSSVLFPDPSGEIRVEAFDFDSLTKAECAQVARATFSEVAIGHNVGFDAYWNSQHTSHRPQLLLDTMLIARVLFPEQPLVMAGICNDQNEDEELRLHAEAMFQQGRSGWSLADLAVGRLRKALPKDFQGPKNWCEPFLSQASYDYATGDVKETFNLLMSLLGLEQGEHSRLLERYFELRAQMRPLRIIEPQVKDILAMRVNGMPWDVKRAEAYVESQWDKVREAAAKMVAMVPSLKDFEAVLAEPEKGVTANLKEAIGQAFESRGLQLEMTSKANTFKIGEKDLRKVKAQVNSEAKELFDVWIALNRAKKAGGMAKEVTAYAIRSGDNRLHPNTGHGPVTGRLSSSEPNCQQFPRDQGFRDGVTAREGYKIMASDYSALDMRVGAALAIRAQRQIFEAYMGDRACAPDVLRCISRIYEGKVSLEQVVKEEFAASIAFEQWKAKRDEVDYDSRKTYWDEYRRRARVLLLAGFQRCLKEVRIKADLDNALDWGSLRDAFSIPGMDIHSWTALGMIGKDPKAMFSGLSNEEVALALKKAKKELGDKRQTGKVGNLSLLYAMKTLGLVEAAAKNYNIHWTFEEGDKVRNDWLKAYVEIDLWHKWTELNPVTSVFVPDPERGMKYVKKDVFASYTLGNRLIYAFGLNAALSYEDQSTGADILGLVMETLRERHSEVFSTVINQVHDELVFEIADEHVEGYTRCVEDVMTEAAEAFLMPFGVKGECSPIVGQTWLKD